MNAEDRLRAAMHARTESIEPGPEGWDRIQGRIAMNRNRRRRYIAVPAAAAAVAAVLLGVSLLGDDRPTPLATDTTESTAAAPTPTTGTPSTSAPTTTVTPPTPTPAPYLWPPETGPSFGDANKLSLSFAVEFLGMKSPVVSAFRQNEPNAGEIDIRSNPRTTTRIMLAVLRNESGWVVNDAHSTNIILDTPETFQIIKSPVRLTGKSVTYEGNVLMTLLEDGQTLARGTRIGDGFFTGHGSEMTPFEATLSFRAPKTRAGRLVLWTRSADDGNVFEATVRRVRFTG